MTTAYRGQPWSVLVDGPGGLAVLLSAKVIPQPLRASFAVTGAIPLAFPYALALIALALTYAGHTWGLGRLRARLPFMQRHSGRARP